MDITGDRRIPAPRDRVWQALDDVATLRACLPSCERLERAGEHDLVATLDLGQAGAAGQFHARARQLDRDAPGLMRVAFEGEGPRAGFARGEATLRLVADGDNTVLSYAVQGHGGGAATPADPRRMIDGFLDRLVQEVGGLPADPIAADGAAGLVAAATEPVRPGSTTAALLASIPHEPLGFPRVAWIGSAIFLVIFVLIFGSYVL